jgi:hypothetical protein
VVGRFFWPSERQRPYHASLKSDCISLLHRIEYSVNQICEQWLSSPLLAISVAQLVDDDRIYSTDDRSLDPSITGLLVLLKLRPVELSELRYSDISEQLLWRVVQLTR